jgi:hypothetical protein
MKKLALSITAWLLAASTAMAQVVTGSVPNTFVNGTIIDATQVNADYSYIISQVNANAAKNGVNSDITALISLSTAITPAQGGSNIYYAGAATGTANAIVVATAIPANFTLATGKTIRFIGGASANTGAATLAVNSTTATAIVKQTTVGTSALTGGEVQPGQLVECYYDGTQFELLNNPQQQGGYGPLTNLAASATPDLGTTWSHNVNLTGGPFTITSFGSSANAAYPAYLVRFNAANTLTNSASLNLINSSNRLTATGDEGIYLYNGAGVWYELAYFPAGAKYTPTQANALTVKNNAVTPNTKIDIAAAEVVMDNASGGNYYAENYGSCTIDMTVTGAAGLDTGTIAASTWYYIYAISNGSAVSCLGSASATTPTLPTGYVYKVRLGAIRTSSAAATLWPFYQQGNATRLNGLPAVPADTTVASGVSGTCGTAITLTATSSVWGAFIPTTARTIIGTVGEVAGAQTCISSATATGASPSSASCSTNTSSLYTGNEFSANYMGVATLYYCGSGAGSIVAMQGWIDHVNAN